MRTAEQRVRNQHFCPRFYLKGFCFEDEKGAQKLWRYGVRGRGLDRRARAPRSVCSSDYFYDTELDHIHPNDVQQVDEYLSKFENDVYAPALRALVRNGGRVRLTKRFKRTWSRIILSQRTRTPAARQHNVDVMRAAFAGPVSDIMEKPVQPIMSDSEHSALHANRMASPANIKIMNVWARRFAWTVVQNATNIPLITSDNPVCFATFDEGRYMYDDGAIANDAIHFFPISRSILLLLARPRVARSLRLTPLHKCTDETLINVANERQLFNAQNYVLGPDNDYMSDVIDPLRSEIKRMHPDMWTGDYDVRRAIEVNGEILAPALVNERLEGSAPMRVFFGPEAHNEEE